MKQIMHNLSLIRTCGVVFIPVATALFLGCSTSEQQIESPNIKNSLPTGKDQLKTFIVPSGSKGINMDITASTFMGHQIEIMLTSKSSKVVSGYFYLEGSNTVLGAINDVYINPQYNNNNIDFIGISHFNSEKSFSPVSFNDIERIKFKATKIK